MGKPDKSKEEIDEISTVNSTTSTIPKPSLEQAPESNERAEVIEQARKFLEEENVKNTDKEKKISFLKSKGLSSDEIEALIREEEKTEIHVPSITNKSSLESWRKEKDRETLHREYRTNSTPPIITYPEFLTNPPSKSSPLLTRSRLLALLYTSSFLSASIYGTFEYIVSPMIERLAHCRHELHISTLLKLETLSEKLVGLVSKIPDIGQSHLLQDNENENEEEENDLTQLFHRDIGTQTSPPGSPSQINNPQTTQDPLTLQTNHLNELNDGLRVLDEILADEAQKDADMETAITELREYLFFLAYPSHPNNHLDGKLMSSILMTGYSGGKIVDSQYCEITRAKGGIKGMKSLLLSTRSFPALRPEIFSK